MDYSVSDFKVGSLVHYKGERPLSVGIVISIRRSISNIIWDDYAKVLWHNGKLKNSFTDNLILLK
jgi:hypothetical protein